METEAAQTSPPAPARSTRRRLVVLAVAIVVVGVALITRLDAASEALIDQMFRPLSSPPARLVVCNGVMNWACAQRAADRIGTTVAWLDEPPGYRLEWFVANRHAEAMDPASSDGVIATQYFVGGSDDRGMFEVVTSAPPLPFGPPPPRPLSVSNGTDAGSFRVDEVFGTASIEWTHEGITYVITARPRPWDPAAVVDAWKTIRYTSPKSP
jgi:hypothetical protein